MAGSKYELRMADEKTFIYLEALSIVYKGCRNRHVGKWGVHCGRHDGERTWLEFNILGKHCLEFRLILR